MFKQKYFILNKMIHVKKIFFFIFLLSFSSFSQEEVTLSGIVYDQNNNETLYGVSIYFPELNSGTTTNEYGFYSITIPDRKSPELHEAAGGRVALVLRE